MRGPYRKGSVISALLVVLLFAAAIPAPTTTAHHESNFAFPRTGLAFGIHDGNRTWNATFQADPWREERLVGYLEERDVVTVSVGSEYDPYQWVFDRGTGQDLGFLDADVWSDGVGVLPEEALREETRRNDFHGGWAGVHWMLPESVLWGRPLQGGETWEVTGHTPHCDRRETVEVAEDRSVVTITSLCVREEGVHETVWTLKNPLGTSPFGAERHYAHTYSEDGAVVQERNGTRPITIYDQGTHPIFFGGSEAFVVRDRDQTLRYGPLGLIPYDPDPLPSFDVPAAARAALQHDGAALRAFFAQADDPRLVQARVGFDHPDSMVGGWSVTFADGHNRSATVTFLGVRTEDGMTMIEDRSYSWGGSEMPPDQDEAVFAAPGDLARATLKVFEENRIEPVSFTWRAGPFASFDASGKEVCDQTTGGGIRVGLDLRMGVVHWTNDWDEVVASDVPTPYQPLEDCVVDL